MQYEEREKKEVRQRKTVKRLRKSARRKWEPYVVIAVLLLGLTLATTATDSDKEANRESLTNDQTQAQKENIAGNIEAKQEAKKEREVFYFKRPSDRVDEGKNEHVHHKAHPGLTDLVR